MGRGPERPLERANGRRRRRAGSTPAECHGGAVRGGARDLVDALEKGCGKDLALEARPEAPIGMRHRSGRCRWRRRRSRPARPLRSGRWAARGAPRVWALVDQAEGNPIRGGTVTVTDGVATIDAAFRPASHIFTPGPHGSLLCQARARYGTIGAAPISGRALRSSSRAWWRR